MLNKWNFLNFLLQTTKLRKKKEKKKEKTLIIFVSGITRYKY
jgi:hypothetical protein